MKRDRDKLQKQLGELESEIEYIESEHEYKMEGLKQVYKDKLDALDERWTEKVDNEVEKHLRAKVRGIRQDAIARSRVGQLGKTIEKIAPMFPGFGHHPSDVRPIFDPIDFVIFDGYFRGGVTDVVFVEFKTGQSRLTPVQASIREAVDKKRVYFEERRMSRESIRMLTHGHRPRLRQLVE
jgi:predicted Holliday junction resolvase-like endonuclease